MKDINVNRIKFSDLVEERYFTLPSFQREYSWDEENWEEFIQSITSFIDNKKSIETDKKRKLNQQQYFAGDIILKKGNQDNDFSVIIDGQQRLVTIFILLRVISEKTKDPNIDKILFLTKKEDGQEEKEIRISLINKYDKQEFEKALGFSQDNEALIKRKGRKRKDGNILNARKFFLKFFETETEYKPQEIYEVITKNFYFALVEIHHNDKVQELFTALNNTGLNLSNSDLLKSLLIKKSKPELEKQIIQTWENRIVEVITEASKRQTINREMDRFLIDFWLAKFWEKNSNEKQSTSKLPTKLNIYDLFERKITDNNKASEMLNLLADYADVYKNVKEPNALWWEESFWPFDIFYTVSDIATLNFSQLFPIVLKIYFEFKESPKEAKKMVIKELETILLFIFRLITIKGKSPGDIPRFVPSIIEEITIGKKLFNNDLKKQWLEKEFSEEGKEKFYNEFYIYSTKRNKIWEFVLKNYYWKKFQIKFGVEKTEKSTLDFRQAIYNWKNLSVEHLIPQSVLKSEPNSKGFEEDVIYSLGNVTLVDGKVNSQISNDVWKRKKIALKYYGNNCPLNWEESGLFDSDELTPEIIKKRSKNLINEFKSEKIKLFDIDWEQN